MPRMLTPEDLDDMPDPALRYIKRRFRERLRGGHKSHWLRSLGGWVALVGFVWTAIRIPWYLSGAPNAEFPYGVPGIIVLGALLYAIGKHLEDPESPVE